MKQVTHMGMYSSPLAVTEILLGVNSVYWGFIAARITSLREDVFSRVCFFGCSGGGPMMPLVSPHTTWTCFQPSNLFTHTSIGMQAVGLRQKGLLVSFSN